MNIPFVWLQDLYSSQHKWGGAELADDVIITKLREKGHEVTCWHTYKITPNIIKGFNGRFIVSNFGRLSEDCKYALQAKDYIIYEHDSKWNKRQDLSYYKDYKVPPEDIINFNFYESAKKVVLQTKRHLELTQMNLGLKNLISAGGNPWTDEDLELLESLQGVEKIYDHAILEHPYPQKNFTGAIQYALTNRLKFGVIYQTNHEDFLRQLAQYRALIFLPTVYETFSRVSAEARALDLALILSPTVSFQTEDYAILSGMDLINYFRQQTGRIVNLFIE